MQYLFQVQLFSTFLRSVSSHRLLDHWPLSVYHASIVTVASHDTGGGTSVKAEGGNILVTGRP
jgi:hypothetical protein